ncbi:MAG: hypothetical protein K6F91_10550 [Ruminococcus sp.]|nr:hypothetical protein [Ruminococcus sp.]
MKRFAAQRLCTAVSDGVLGRTGHLPPMMRFATQKLCTAVSDGVMIVHYI